MKCDIMNAIGIIDADMLGYRYYKFPNLACMKISSYYKDLGYDVKLIEDYSEVPDFDTVYISKVFTDTSVPPLIDYYGNKIIKGGTGFYFDKSPNLPHEIEYSFPDYHLYDDVLDNIGLKKSKRKYFTDTSIGYTTRGCFRKCFFCVNKSSNKCVKVSDLEQIVDMERKYIYLLDDNLLAYKYNMEILDNVISLNKPYNFAQGLDVRLMKPTHLEKIENSKLWGDMKIAFDNYGELDSIEPKLKMVSEFENIRTQCYLFTGYNPGENDIIELFKRIKICMDYKIIPYVMRHQNYQNSNYRGLYINIARWTNQPRFFKKMSFRDFINRIDAEMQKKSSALKYLEMFEDKFGKWYDMKWE